MDAVGASASEDAAKADRGDGWVTDEAGDAERAGMSKEPRVVPYPLVRDSLYCVSD